MLENAPKNKEYKNWWRPGAILFFQMSAWVGAPVIIGLFVGRWFDDTFGTEPWLFLLATGFAFIISIVGMIREATKAMRVLDSEKNNKKNE